MSWSPDSERLHGGWLEHKSSEKNKWNPVWCVLKRKATSYYLFFFTSEEPSFETHIGTLTMGRDSSFHYGPGDQREGYRFDLHISKKKNKFRVKKKYDRELWRAYIAGVVTGVVPEDANLSPGDVQTIEGKFRHVQHAASLTSPGQGGQAPPSLYPSSSSPDRRPSAPVTPDLPDGSASSSGRGTDMVRRSSVPSIGSAETGSSGEGGFDPPHSLSGFSLWRDPSSNSSDDSGVTGVSDNAGGPFMHHKFDKAGNASPPSWFFEDCNRELAEKILQECRPMGNTLMRVSSSARPTGSYVISKRLESSGNVVHYEVVRVSEGYRINAENITRPMRTLSEVMDSFIQLSGPSTTHPMRCNDLHRLGVEYSAYHRGPIGPPPQDSAVSSVNDDPLDSENYEIPQQQSTRVGSPPSAPFAPPLPVPPCPAPAPPPPSSSSSSAPTKPPFHTWGRDTTGDARWQGQQTGGSAAKTLGPGDRRQFKPDNAKPSVMQVHQSIHEQGGQDKPPPLPQVPADRPKLCTSASAVYINAASVAPEKEEEADAVHQRWNKRSQSVPVLPKDVLGANAAPVPGMIPELQEKLRKRALQIEQSTSASGAAGESRTATQAARSQEEEEDPGELYEDINQYYQNLPQD